LLGDVDPNACLINIAQTVPSVWHALLNVPEKDADADFDDQVVFLILRLS
jgi:hypothetical protein